jgi:hypothetical protein
MLTELDIVKLLDAGVTTIAVSRSKTYKYYNEIVAVYFLIESEDGKVREVAHLTSISNNLVWHDCSWGENVILFYELYDLKLLSRRYIEGVLYNEPKETIRRHVCSINRVWSE